MGDRDSVAALLTPQTPFILLKRSLHGVIWTFSDEIKGMTTLRGEQHSLCRDRFCRARMRMHHALGLEDDTLAGSQGTRNIYGNLPAIISDVHSLSRLHAQGNKGSLKDCWVGLLSLHLSNTLTSRQ